MTTTKIPVPYVTAWSTEHTPPPTLIQLPNNRGIAYPDETLGDRDTHGILWQRTPLAQGKGTPQYDIVHPARQRRAMRKLLCQVCAGPANHNTDGTLWLLKDHRTDWPNWPNGMAVTEPPICTTCLPIATRSCPALRNNHAIIRATHHPLVGVQGALYGPTPQGPKPRTSALTRHSDPHRHWVLATNLLRELTQATILNP